MNHLLTFALLASLTMTAHGTASPPSAMPAHGIATFPVPTVSFVGRTLQICQPPRAGSSLPMCRTGRLPSKFATITRAVTFVMPASSGASAQPARPGKGSTEPTPSMERPPLPGEPGEKSVGLWSELASEPLHLLFESEGQAIVCNGSHATILCAQVAAPVPGGVSVEAMILPGGYTVFTYARAPGVTGAPDPQGQAALRFQVAVDRAAAAVRGYLSAQTRSIGHVQDDYEFDPSFDDPVASPGDLGGGGYFPIIVISAPLPDPIDPGPFIVAGADVIIDDTPFPQLPPRYPDEDLAAVLDPCVISPIMTVCVRGTRPPPPPDEFVLPSAPTPWFPQSWCDTFHILCSKGQEPHDNDRGADSSTTGKTLEQLKQICESINMVDMDVCHAAYAVNKNGSDWITCKNRANAKMFACYDTARSLTDDGAHVAP